MFINFHCNQLYNANIFMTTVDASDFIFCFLIITPRYCNKSLNAILILYSNLFIISVFSAMYMPTPVINNKSFLHHFTIHSFRHQPTHDIYFNRFCIKTPYLVSIPHRQPFFPILVLVDLISRYY